MAQFVVVIVGNDAPDGDAQDISRETIRLMKEAGCVLYESTYITVAGEGERVNLEEPEPVA